MCLSVRHSSGNFIFNFPLSLKSFEQIFLSSRFFCSMHLKRNFRGKFAAFVCISFACWNGKLVHFQAAQ